MANNTFQTRRFYNFLRYLASAEYGRLLAFIILPIVVVLIFFFVQSLSYSGTRLVRNEQEVVFITSAILSSIAYFGSFFREFRTKAGTIAYLQIPTSAFEKTLAVFLWNSVVFPLVFMLSFYPLSLLFDTVGEAMFANRIFVPFSFTYTVISIITFAFVFLPAVLFISANFKTVPLVRVIIIAIALFVVFQTIESFKYSNENRDVQSFVNHQIILLGIGQWFFKSLPVIAALLWISLAFRLKEKEV